MNSTKDLFEETEKCISCGFCEAVCPTLPSMNYRSIYGARGRVLLAREVVKNINESGKVKLKINDPFYTCLDCYACFYVCPAGVNAGKVSEMVKDLVTEKKYVKKQEKNIAKMIKESIMKYQNPLGIKEKLSSWSDGMEFNNNSETLFYTGGMYQLMAYSKYLSNLEKKINPEIIENVADAIAKNIGALKFTSLMYDKNLKDRMDNILKSIVELLKYSGIEFDYLGDDEPYSGAFLFELGYIDEFVEYGKKLMDIFKKRNISKIITIDPHTYEVLKSTYPKYIKDFQFDVHHYLEFININNFIKSNEKLTFHEPCHFVTHEKYDKPLKFVSKIGDVVLPDRHGTNVFCCGGPDELLYPKLSESISQKRFEQLKTTGAEKIVTACPICFVNLYKDETVYDLAELLIKNKKSL